ncbi:MAG TPA: exosortase/archaeosortase family protein [Jatrophihabitantaceae bacterium]
MTSETPAFERPLTFSLPTERARLPRSRPGVIAGLSMYAMALWMAVDNAAFRHYEASIITPMISFVTGRRRAVTSDTLIWFARGTPRVFGLYISSGCTSALLLIPLFVVIGSFSIFTRMSLTRQLSALVAGAALIVGVNVLRMTGIAWATWKFGRGNGYTLSHLFVGSAFSLLGFVAAMLVALWILVRGHRSASSGRGRVGDDPGGDPPATD